MFKLRRVRNAHHLPRIHGTERNPSGRRPEVQVDGIFPCHLVELAVPRGRDELVDQRGVRGHLVVLAEGVHFLPQEAPAGHAPVVRREVAECGGDVRGVVRVNHNDNVHPKELLHYVHGALRIHQRTARAGEGEGGFCERGKTVGRGCERC